MEVKMLETLKTWVIGGCAIATVILACILPALAVLSFTGFALAMLFIRKNK